LEFDTLQLNFHTCAKL